MQDGRWTIRPCPYREAVALARELGVSEITASVLVRRGYGDPADAAAFLAGEDGEHDPYLLGDMAAAVEALRAAVAAGKRICVHGDYDADGISATALALLTLRELGADVSWYLPSRFEDGYGVSSEAVERLAADGADLLLTVDCGITAVEEVAAAKALGLEVIVTDHHRPAEALPDCPIVATRPSSYPFPELCGTGVVHKLAQALLGADHPALARHLDLVALATIADVVPLLDENRALVTAGLRALACTQKPGLQALMRSAQVDPAALDSGNVGFRLAPRLNAAGRLGRPDLALDLILTEDRGEASRLAAELDALNRERQSIEDRILREAVAQVESWSATQRRRRGYVVAGEEWHEGVIGIVASRLVERFSRPVVMVAGTGEEWKGSGRSITAFDLYGALAACSSELIRFGGHRAAAGLTIHRDRVETFAEAFATHAETQLSDDDLTPLTVVDAVVPASALTLGLAQELDRLAPFGLGNPDVTLLAAGCEAVEPTTVGEGKHLRFRICQDGKDGGSAIAFGRGGQLDRLRRDARYDVAFRLKENHWNGTVAPQLVVRSLFDSPAEYAAMRAWLADLWRAGESEWTPEAARIFAELELVESGGKRQLLESEAFRTLLSRESLPRAA
jgi:single-stranded-DNA-specific exonuclease